MATGPSDQSITWQPASGPPPSDASFPVSLTQAALRRVQAHIAESPNQGVMGFLVGKVVAGSGWGGRSVLVEGTMRVAGTLEKDDTATPLGRVWSRMNEELGKKGGQLIGWYHSHPPLDVSLSMDDLTTHRKHFGEPWQVALVIGVAAGAPAAGLYRLSADPSFPPTLLPFNEVLEAQSILPDGKKKTVVQWKTYRATVPHATAAPGAPAPGAGAQPVAPNPPPPRVSAMMPMPPAAAPPPSAPPLVPMPASPPLAPKAPPPPPPKAPPPPPPAPSAPPAPRISGRVPAPPPPRAPAPPPPPPRRSIRMSARLPAPPEPRRRGGGPGLLTVVLVLVLAAGGAWAAGLIDLSRFGIKSLGGGGGAPSDTTARAAAPGRDAGSAVFDRAPPVEAIAPPSEEAQTPQPVVAPPTVTRDPDLYRDDPPPVPASNPAFSSIDQAADSLALAVRMYRDVETRGGDCAALGRVREVLDAAVGRYNIAKNASTRAMDDLRMLRDRALYAGADSVDARFRRAGCRAS
jgi:proteasome lid subunit RPN8/RPN11